MALKVIGMIAGLSGAMYNWGVQGDGGVSVLLAVIAGLFLVAAIQAADEDKKGEDDE